MSLALRSDQVAGSTVSSYAARLQQSLRFDGLWWRKLAALGCGYGPEWVKRYLPAPIAAMMFLLVRLNRRGRDCQHGTHRRHHAPHRGRPGGGAAVPSIRTVGGCGHLGA